MYVTLWFNWCHLIESSLIYDQDVADYCTKVEKNILLPGCVGDHVPIVTRALDLIGQRCSTAEVKRIHKIILHESSKYNCDKVIDLVFRIAQFDNAELLKAITLACEFGSIKTLRCLLSKYPCDSPRSGSCGRGCSSNFSRLVVGRPRGGRFLLETLDCGLYIAALNGHAEVVKTLIQEGAYVFEVTSQYPDEKAPKDMSSTEKERDRIYHTALQAALSGFKTVHRNPYRQISAEDVTGREACIMLLLEHGANADASNEGSDKLLSVTIEHCFRQNCSVDDRQRFIIDEYSFRKNFGLQNCRWSGTRSSWSDESPSPSRWIPSRERSF